MMKRLIEFFEIPATDFERAVKFYETVCGLTLSVLDCGVEKMAFFPEEDGNSPGAISYAEGFKPSENGVLISLCVENMEAALLCIENQGGKILRGKTQIESPDRGYFAIFIDSEGNRMGLFSKKG